METMYYIGLDVHKKTIDYCVKDGSGRIYAAGSIRATRLELDMWMKTLPRPRTAAMEATIFTAWIYIALILNGLKRVLKPALDIHYIHSREGDGVRALGTLPVAIWTISLLYVRVNHFRVRLDTGKITRGEVSRRQRRSFYAYPTT